MNINESYYYDNSGMLFLGDCLEWMPKIPDKSIDMILCDMPYGVTDCKWDTIIPLDLLWAQYKRIIKDNGAIVLTASQPFTSTLVMSNIKMFKYEWIWEKEQGTNYLLCKKRPLKSHENILVFSNNQTIYNPQMIIGEPYIRTGGGNSEVYGNVKKIHVENKGIRYPKTIIKIKRDNRNTGRIKNKIHPSQKPAALFEYLIKTYTNEGDVVLDNCAGSCTTAIACKNTNRKWICIEKEEKYCKLSKKRILENRPILLVI